MELNGYDVADNFISQTEAERVQKTDRLGSRKNETFNMKNAFKGCI